MALPAKPLLCSCLAVILCSAALLPLLFWLAAHEGKAADLGDIALERHARLHSGLVDSKSSDSTWPVPSWMECWFREKFGPLSAFEVNHYFLRSLSEAKARRRGRMAGEADIRAKDRRCKCRTAGRALRFLEVMKDIQNLSWSDRVARYHRGTGPNGQFCIRSYHEEHKQSGEPTSITCRPHFLTAGSLRLHESDGPLQAQYVLEWLDFHTAVGFDHFYIWLMFGVRNETMVALRPYIDHGIVTVLPCWAWRLENGTVVPTYGKNNVDLRLPKHGQCMSDFPTGVEALGMGQNLQRFQNRDAIDIQQGVSFWTAIFDLDEYYFPARAATMQEVLSPLTTLDPAKPKAFATSVLFYGTSGWVTPPLMHTQVEAYMLSEDRRNANVKTLALVDAVADTYAGSVHGVAVSPFKACVLSLQAGFLNICLESQWKVYHGIGTCSRIVFGALVCLGALVMLSGCFCSASGRGLGHMRMRMCAVGASLSSGLSFILPSMIPNHEVSTPLDSAKILESPPLGQQDFCIDGSHGRFTESAWPAPVCKQTCIPRRGLRGMLSHSSCKRSDPDGYYAKSETDYALGLATEVARQVRQGSGLKEACEDMVDRSTSPPRMSFDEINLLVRTMSQLQPRSYLEWGGGLSTSLYPLLASGPVYIIDYYLPWCEAVLDMPVVKCLREKQHRLKTACVQPVRSDGSRLALADRGYPANSSDTHLLGKSYVEELDSLGMRRIDAALVDGRFRVACALKLLAYFHEKSVLFLHDFWSWRQSYDVVLKYYDAIGTSSSLVVLRRKSKSLLPDGWEVEYHRYIDDPS